MKNNIIAIYQKKEPLKNKYNEFLAILLSRSATPDSKKKYFQNGFTPAKYEQLVRELCNSFKIKTAELKSKVATMTVEKDAVKEDAVNEDQAEEGVVVMVAVNQEAVNEGAVKTDEAPEEKKEAPKPTAKKKPAKKAPKKNSKG